MIRCYYSHFFFSLYFSSSISRWFSFDLVESIQDHQVNLANWINDMKTLNTQIRSLKGKKSKQTNSYDWMIAIFHRNPIKWIRIQYFISIKRTVISHSPFSLFKKTEKNPKIINRLLRKLKMKRFLAEFFRTKV